MTTGKVSVMVTERILYRLADTLHRAARRAEYAAHSAHLARTQPIPLYPLRRARATR